MPDSHTSARGLIWRRPVSNRQVVLGVVGAALIAAGLLALWFPVHVGQYDQWGMQISCGRGFNASLSQTPEAHDAGLAGQCETALLLRRLWAIPAAIIGWVLVTVVAVIWVRSTPDDAEESTRFWELRGDAT
jgi:hypothetical protein